MSMHKTLTTLITLTNGPTENVPVATPRLEAIAGMFEHLSGEIAKSLSVFDNHLDRIAGNEPTKTCSNATGPPPPTSVIGRLERVLEEFDRISNEICHSLERLGRI